MIKQVFDAESYYRVIVFWNIDYNFFDDIAFELRMIDFPEAAIEETYHALKSGEAKAVTCSSVKDLKSIVVFNPHSSKADYISSIVHEAEHIKQAMLQAYNIEDKGEPPAYTIGYLVGRMWEVFKRFICTKENS